MPELEWHYGYYTLWVFMIMIAVGMIVFFKRKRWL
jgi:magnesium transporter